MAKLLLILCLIAVSVLGGTCVFWGHALMWEAFAYFRSPDHLPSWSNVLYRGVLLVGLGIAVVAFGYRIAFNFMKRPRWYDKA